MKTSYRKPIKTVLFDLDGTLLDTAPDLAYALNRLRQHHGLADLPFHEIRPASAHGSKGLLQLGFGISDNDPNYSLLQQQLLSIYADNIAKQTCLFPGMAEVLQHIEQGNMQWGIVTNKPGRLTNALLHQLNILPHHGCVVSGDTISKRKPSPEPLWYACELLKCDAADCLYIGDAECDITAGNSAGMQTLVALYGYLSDLDQPQQWQASGYIKQPHDIIEWLNAA